MNDENERRDQDMNSPKINVISTRTSSFEALDPYDPNISRLATNTFEKTADYLHGQLSATEAHYKLLEEMNRAAINKYSDIKLITINLEKKLTSVSDMYSNNLEQILVQIDAIDETVSKFETAALKLDSYTRELKKRFLNIEKR